MPLGVANFEVPDICAGKPVTLVDKSNIVGNIISQWKWDIDGKIYTDQNPTHTFMSQGRYLVKLSVANASGCWSDVTQQTIMVTKDFPKLEFNALQPVCFVGNPVQFVASEKIGLTVDASKSFFKSNGKGLTTTGVFSPSIAGVGVHKITYVFSSIQGCTDSISQDIEVYATTVINIPPTVYILSGGQKVIPVKINLPNTNYKYKYKWMPSIGLSSDTVLNPIAFPSVDTKYILTVSIDGYCSVSKEVLVKVLDKVEAPNSFSPNGDGINDVWNIASLDSYPNADIEVFNRNGQKVFVSKGYTVPFDGIYQNKPLPVGVYYYRISPNNGRKTISGALTIIR